LAIYQAVDKLEEKEIDKIGVIIDYFDENNEDNALAAEEQNDVVDEMPKPEDSAS